MNEWKRGIENYWWTENISKQLINTFAWYFPNFVIYKHMLHKQENNEFMLRPWTSPKTCSAKTFSLLKIQK